MDYFTCGYLFLRKWSENENCKYLEKMEQMTRNQANCSVCSYLREWGYFGYKSTKPIVVLLRKLGKMCTKNFHNTLSAGGAKSYIWYTARCWEKRFEEHIHTFILALESGMQIFAPMQQILRENMNPSLFCSMLIVPLFSWWNSQNLWFSNIF